jgi:hypothetical protein
VTGLFYDPQRLTGLGRAAALAGEELTAVSSPEPSSADAVATASTVAAALAEWRPWFATAAADTSMTSWMAGGPTSAPGAPWPPVPEGYRVVTSAELAAAWGDELAAEFVTDVTHNVAYHLACVAGYNAADGNVGLSSSSSGPAASPHLCFPLDPAMAARLGDPYVIGHVVPEGETDAAAAVLDAEATHAAGEGVEQVEYLGADGSPSNPYVDAELPTSGTMEAGNPDNRFVELPAGMVVTYRLAAPGIYEVRVHADEDNGVPVVDDDLYANVVMSEPQWPLQPGVPDEAGAVIDVIDLGINLGAPS